MNDLSHSKRNTHGSLSKDFTGVAIHMVAGETTIDC